MQKTLQTLITETEREIYQMAGPSVQLYAQDLLGQKIINAFDRCFSAKFWPQFTAREIRTLDGATGKVSSPFTLVTKWDDVHSVFRKNSRKPIPTLPMSYNILDLQLGGVIRFIEASNDATLFTAYPLDATDQLVVVGRVRPATEFALADVIPFDHLALIYHAAWEYSVDDASNAAMAAKFQGMFDSRMKQLEDDAFDNVVALDPGSGEIPMQWYHA